MKKKTQIKIIIWVVLILIVLIAALVIGRIIEKNTPTKERMSYNEYFSIEEGGQIVFFNNERIDAPFCVKAGIVYMPLTYVQENFNKRFYLDIHDNTVMYTTARTVLYHTPGEQTYTDMEGGTYNEDYVVVSEEQGELYIALDYVMKYADFNYRYYADPVRLILWDSYGTASYVNPTEDAVMRYDADIKSPIIRDVTVSDALEVLEELPNGWLKVGSEDGYCGFVQTKYTSDSFERTQASAFVPEEVVQSIAYDGKINLVWNAIGASIDGDKVESALKGTKGINVISPTWYGITSNEGDLRTYANKSYVDRCHELGIMVWPLMDDFDSSLDGVELYSNRETRAKLIARIIDDSRTYGFDGINIDFEKVTKESVAHYLQFIRELSLACKKEELVLSIDNYVPAAHNLYYDRQEQGIFADYIIVMGYDEHWAGSDAGSVASIGFVQSGIEDTLKEVPAAKVINAMPFYTRIWVETTEKDGSITTTSKAVGMETAYNTIIKSGYPAIWDEDCAQYYCSYEYEDGNSVVKIWLEDAASIEAKMQLFAEHDLAGVAAWRLGFEKLEVWDVICSYLQ